MWRRGNVRAGPEGQPRLASLDVCTDDVINHLLQTGGTQRAEEPMRKMKDNRYVMSLVARELRFKEIYAGLPKGTTARLEQDLEKAVLPGLAETVHQGLSNWLDLQLAGAWGLLFDENERKPPRGNRRDGTGGYLC